MEMITETEFVKDAGNILNRLVSGGKEIVITRKIRKLPKSSPLPAK